MMCRSKVGQQGIGLPGFIFILMMIAMIVMLAMNVVPTVVEYNMIRRAIVSAKMAGTSVREIQAAFDKQAGIDNISAIAGKDLEITKRAGNIEVSFAYQKKIPLFGPASLVLDYLGSTANPAASAAVN
jgi:hypothetical protein